MKLSEFKIAFVLLLTMVLCTAPASAGSAERALPSSVNPDEVFQVTVNVADYGAVGQVLEKLPAGFTYINSTLPEEAVTVNGNKVSFLLLTEKNFSYTLKAPASAGTYQFVGLLRDINKTEFSVLPASSSIKVKSTSSGGSGHSSSSSLSGGSGGSPELQSNVKAKELSQAFVTAGTHVKFDFPNGVTCIRYVEFDAKKTLGKITTIVEMLKDQSKMVSSLPEGTVYQNVNIWVGSGGIANAGSLENAVVGFRVDKTWLEENKVDADSLNLWYYDNSWSKLDTKKLDEDSDTYVYFEAKTPDFGPFVIVAADKESGPTEVEPVPTEEVEPDVASEPNPSGWPIPGFESVAFLGTVGAAYCVLRRKF
ncbi:MULTISPECIES: PGF-pre-PGF domain-containing protein [unclassified Methanosarcina]|uniref:PGF-pre-PGF domain-containing protein n=1 Tax=unclassified Methanosarcina TaxID=2644672 RepID=UPI0006160294|nr:MULTISPECIES: PGF-pre-PGF domain-containing protein [unclassified Methanosarcina]AKB18427.1 Cell surface protein [Methanosarcina sp. WWM596]AKB22022.1 Cell surface protein [Methanosarcina sp. WH1]